MSILIISQIRILHSIIGRLLLIVFSILYLIDYRLSIGLMVTLDPELQLNLRQQLSLLHQIRRALFQLERLVTAKIARKMFNPSLMESILKLRCNKLWESAKDLTSHNAFIKHF